VHTHKDNYFLEDQMTKNIIFPKNPWEDLGSPTTGHRVPVCDGESFQGKRFFQQENPEMAGHLTHRCYSEFNYQFDHPIPGSFLQLTNRLDCQKGAEKPETSPTPPRSEFIIRHWPIWESSYVSESPDTDALSNKRP
jgi:hypothetical protein